MTSKLITAVLLVTKMQMEFLEYNALVLGNMCFKEKYAKVNLLSQFIQWICGSYYSVQWIYYFHVPCVKWN